MTMGTPRRSIWQWLPGRLMVVLLIGLFLASVTDTVTAVRVSPDISIQVVQSIVEPGGIVRYKIQVDNTPSDEALKRLEVTVPYQSNQMTLIGRKLRSDKDWIKEVSGSKVTVQFEGIGAKSARSATLEFQTRPDLPDSTVIEGRGKYSWYSDNASDSGDTNRFRVTIQNPNILPQATIVPPGGPAGTVFTMSANRLAPRDYVVTWLNLPDGSVLPLSLAGYADLAGNIQLSYNSTGLAPGNYTMVLYASESGREYTVSFIIQ
ncbi:MAG: hypothetical protein HC837_08860 [Chloroflexaceae bacterium]|nr:hypothetical protein [Chloroflexaceae bacterium]